MNLRKAASLLLALAAALAAGLVGCSAGDGTEASPGVPAPASATERSLLYDAEQTLVQRCMKRHGYTLWKVPEHPVWRYAQSLGAERRAAALDTLHGRKRNALTVQLPSGAEVGRSDEGCTAEAERELYGDLTAWFRAEAAATHRSPPPGSPAPAR
ncbi:hypothetical protein ACGFNV_28245 [Streptomyces sp. NPDC048751]|uniref:hypothetical protein n=1 Tax=Streptomyces sp. NPDC048751 TaxID=3365591 RepID=UPI00371AD957